MGLPRDIGWFKGGFFAPTWTEAVKACSSSKGGGQKSQQPSPTMVLRHGANIAEARVCAVLFARGRRIGHTPHHKSAESVVSATGIDNAKTHAIHLDQ